MQERIASGEIVFRSNETRILRKIYLKNQKSRPPESIWFGEDVGTTRAANQELKRIFGGAPPFETPKPVQLIRRILEVATDKGALVLDSFAGSGTTGHAVLEMNKEDGGDRRFILVEMEPDICRQVTAERLKRVVEGHGDREGVGGGFRYCTLGESLFDETGSLDQGVSFADLAAHVFFTETGSPLPASAEGRTPLIGVSNGTAVYLLFNGVLGDKRPNGGNVLTRAVLRSLPSHDGPRVVYGEGCRLGAARLRQEGIVFRQIPYQVQVD